VRETRAAFRGLAKVKTIDVTKQPLAAVCSLRWIGLTCYNPRWKYIPAANGCMQCVSR